MRCPACGHDNDKVIDSRPSDGGEAIRRRRHCLACNHRFTTKEHVERTRKLYVVKRDGSRQPFDSEKILAGMEKACYKRPVSPETLADTAAAIEEELQHRNGHEVSSVEVGRLITERLKQVDQIAYVRFASVYMDYQDVDALLDEVRQSLDNTDITPPHQGRLF